MPNTSLEIVARTDSEIVDFSPFVPAIDSDGRVCYQATLAEGSNTIYLDRERIFAGKVESHPDRNDRGDLCFYGADKLWLNGKAIADGAGPLGPTMNERGSVAYRADGAMWLHANGTNHLIARADDHFADFQGLPVVDENDSAVFRADLRSGGQGIYRWHGNIETIAETGNEFREFGRFPCTSLLGIGFVAQRSDGRFGVFRANPTVDLIYENEAFESIRGMLLWDRGLICFATPAGETLGVYDGDERITGMGDTFEGSPVIDLALNPVSINRRGDLAIRLKVEDGRQFIVRRSHAN